MAYKDLITENVAIAGARRIGIYNSQGNRVGFIPLGPLALPKAGRKQYSFGAISDVHITRETSESDFRAALTYLNEVQDVAFTCICGDLTQNGTAEELAQYKAVVDGYLPNTPVYAISGNHEAYATGTVTTEQLEPYTGQPLYYSFTYGDDVYIMVGTCSGVAGEIFTIQELQWLYETLEANRNKRCFVFQHVFPWGDSGNANNAYAYGDLFAGTRGDVFKALLRHYKNTIFFHGHSHLKFELQAEDSKANYSEAFGYRSIHIPSLAVPRDIIGGSLTDIYADSEGYVVDVYENGIHLRGRDFIRGKFLPIASFWIDTTLQTVPEKGFYDRTGIINVLPDGYTQLDYIESTGTQYINTGFTPNQDSRIVCEVMWLGGMNGFGARSTVSSRNFSVRVIDSKWQLGYGSGVTTGTIAAKQEWQIIDINKNSLYVNGEFSVSRDYVAFSAPYPITLGAIRASSMYYGTAKYRACQIYDNGVLVRNLIPCRNAGGAIGMYDILNGVFYANAGTDEFIAGSAV